MVRSKAQSKKQQNRGVDFKKIKRKVGRKLPPPKNATNTEIKSKAIVLPEQSLAAEKTGLAVSKKGLTLKELLQQTSHPNLKVRRDALIGLRDLFSKHPEELSLHKLAVIEKLRERIGDGDKSVRETLYQLLKCEVFPACKGDSQGPIVRLLMAYIFNAMTYFAVDVRLMAFKYFDLVVQFYPSTFQIYAEKMDCKWKQKKHGVTRILCDLIHDLYIGDTKLCWPRWLRNAIFLYLRVLQSFEDILQNNQLHLQDKGKLKSVLGGLLRCLSLLPGHDQKDDSHEMKTFERRSLHGYDFGLPEDTSGSSLIIKKLNNLVPVLVACFRELHSVSSSDTQSFDCMHFALQSIGLAVKFCVSCSSKSEDGFQNHARSSISIMLDETALSLLMKKLLAIFPLNSALYFSEKEDGSYFKLNAMMTEIFLSLREHLSLPTDLSDRFLEFMETALLDKSHSHTRAAEVIWEKHLLLLLPFVPRLISDAEDHWKSRILQAFTSAFKACNPESTFKLSCLLIVKEMLISREAADAEFLEHQIIWIRELPVLLIQLGVNYPSSSKVVLQLLLCIGQRASPIYNPSYAGEFDDMQYKLQDFYAAWQGEEKSCYGPFLRLPEDCQELAISCLYYFSHLDRALLKSLASCCLYKGLDPLMLFRIIETLQLAHDAGQILVTDFISFLLTLISRFRVLPEVAFPVKVSGSNIGVFRSLTSFVCRSLQRLGDCSVVFQLLETAIFEVMQLELPVDNLCAMLRVLATLDSQPTWLSEENINSLSNILTSYLIAMVNIVQGDDDDGDVSSDFKQMCTYYLVPGLVFFDRCHKVLNLVLNIMQQQMLDGNVSSSCVDGTQNLKNHACRVKEYVSVLQLLYSDAKTRHILHSFKAELEGNLKKILFVQSSLENEMTLEERHQVRYALDQLSDLLHLFPDPIP